MVLPKGLVVLHQGLVEHQGRLGVHEKVVVVVHQFYQQEGVV